ncbi:aluminum-activated malate transporter 12-like [Chenopodium quinoa]|uniref:Aluminum-activated malate transporter 12-like n=1 Tax=Chenopodium quinoa TaxID=63459 RepID=A0A803L5V3_CHEQI|nr:aluminum-activated malate transporter 12-like [Chenopodium quinoa]
MGIDSMDAKAGGPVSSSSKEWNDEKGKTGFYEERLRRFAGLVYRTFLDVGREDPRRVIHAFKVGLSLTLVSLLYLLEPLFNSVGQNAIWAVMTVVVVLEFTAGATLCKGLNRGLGTIMAGSLAFFIEFVANKSDHLFRAIFIAFAVFLIGTSATYIRFFPYIKKNYDYGVVIFLLTFNLITVSSYRVNDVLHIAQQRLYTIAIGCGICLLMSLLVFPHWSGEDLHNSTVSKLEGLANSIEACVQQYFSDSKSEAEEDNLSDDPIYNEILDSKSADEALALYASWEPRASRYCYRFPWKQYVKVGAVLRHFGYTVVALHGCLQTEIQTPKAVRALFKDPCFRLAAEVSKVLRELARSIKNRRHCSPSILSDHLHEALQDLDTALKSQPRLFLNPTLDNHHPAPPNFLTLATSANNGFKNSPTTVSTNFAIPSFKTDSSALLEWKNKRDQKTATATEALTPKEKEGGGDRKMLRPTLSKIAITSLEFAEALPFAAFASLLVETVARLDRVIEEVEELGRIAQFKEFKAGDDIVVKCDDKPIGNGYHNNHLPSHGFD